MIVSFHGHFDDVSMTFYGSRGSPPLKKVLPDIQHNFMRIHKSGSKTICENGFSDSAQASIAARYDSPVNDGNDYIIYSTINIEQFLEYRCRGAIVKVKKKFNRKL